ncbi:Virion core protein [Sea otter poxvirus]|uniref:Virion core protein n=1 Tax=Sea otter poxvirus TaxID=1416741 RepID=A0A2U9QHK8_9POXV|nr:Virion core protein [Sea otter poxvirus]AWU47084.1 Virion core protein [Sea otter poxvirus]
MEIVNIFLETNSGRIRIALNTSTHKCSSCIGECVCTNNVIRTAINNFLDVLDKYIDINRSIFYIALRDKDMFFFKCDCGTTTLINNEFYVFDHGLIITDDDYNERDILAIGFIITDTLPISILPRENVSISVYSCNGRYYDGMI